MKDRREELQEKKKKNKKDGIGLRDLPDLTSKKVCIKFPANIDVLLILTQILTTELEVSGS